MQLQRSRTDVARSLVGATGQVSPGARCSPWRELHQSLGNHRIQRLLQAKLGVSHPDDIYERQVHRVADEVMRMPEPAGLWAAFGSSSAPARIQRLCAECEEGLQRQMPMEEEQPLVQGKREGAGLEEGAAAIEPYVDGLAARGEPLAPGTRAFFEPRFAADFSASASTPAPRPTARPRRSTRSLTRPRITSSSAPDATTPLACRASTFSPMNSRT